VRLSWEEGGVIYRVAGDELIVAAVVDPRRLRHLP
jgi:hypothetical protein